MNWMYHFSDVNIVLLFMVGATVAMGIAQAICHFILHRIIPKESSDLAIGIRDTIINLTALVLAFSLVKVLDNDDRIERLISSEAAEISHLNRILQNYGSAQANEAQRQLKTYTHSILHDEWPDLARGHGNEKTAQLLNELQQKTMNMEFTGERQLIWYKSAQESSYRLAQSRDYRLESTSLQLPNIYWLVILIAFLTNIIVSAVIERTRTGSLVMAMQFAALTAVMSLVVIFDEPYHGSSGASPHSIQKVFDDLPQKIATTQKGQ